MLVAEWCDVVSSMVRCLTAIEPEVGDRAFGRVLDIVHGGPSNPTSIDPAGEWFRSNEGERPGFIYIGASGQDHHFQAEPPKGVDLSAMRVMPASPVGRLWSEIDAAMASASMVVSGEKTAIEGQGGRLIAPCTDAERPMVAALHQSLEVVALLRDPATESLLMRRSAGEFLTNLGKPAADQIETATREIMGLRSHFLTNATVWGVTMVRRECLKRVLEKGPLGPLAGKLFDASGVLSDPEEALRQNVSDLAYAKHGDIVMAVCDVALSQAEDAVQSALDAQDVFTHQLGLYSAAGWANGAMRIAEIVKGHVGPELWPADLLPSVLEGYATKTEEIVVRAQEALAVACVNAGSGEAARRHRAQVAEQGPAKAKELIEDYWFYPRAAMSMLLQ